MEKRRSLVIAFIVWLCAATIVAQEVTGSIVGTICDPDRALLPGVVITVKSTETGLVRATRSNSRGAYRIAALPPGPYRLTASLKKFSTHQQALKVKLGSTTKQSITLEVGTFAGSIDVGAEMPVDLRSSQSGKNLDVDRLDSLLPLNHDTTQIAILVPGTVPGDQRFNPVSQACQTGLCSFTVGWGTPGQNLLSHQGSSIAENLYVVDGLNITNFSHGLGSSFVPMAFVDEVQVIQGGLDAEFGRTTGGVVNMITKSGGNILRGNAAVLWAAEGLQEQRPSTTEQDFENGARHNTEVTASLGGPLVRDELFFFLFLRTLDSERTELPTHARYVFEETMPYWGGKLNWNLSASQRFEATYISDDVNANVRRVVVDPNTNIKTAYPGTMNRGGDNGMLRYTGVLAENLVLTFQAGRNEFDRYDSSISDGCPVALDYRMNLYGQAIGCWAVGRVGSWSDTRAAARADADWLLGKHSLRAGIDYELLTSDVAQGYSGGVRYNYSWAGSRGVTMDLPPFTNIVQVITDSNQGEFEVESNAAYVQDSWALTPYLTLNLGLRWEVYEHRNADGQPFLDVGDQIAPRLGFVWDVSRLGRSKFYGSVGRYHIPYPTAASASYAGAVTLILDEYLLEGVINPDGSPEELGDQLQYVDFPLVFRDGSVLSPHEIAADSVEPASQRELILGYKMLISANWAFGIRGVARQYEEVIEDITLDQGLWEAYGVPCLDPQALTCSGIYRISNPGEAFEGWFDLDDDGELEPVSLTAEQLAYPDPQRKYYAIEFVGSRRFADNWMLEASYVWSHSYGNYEGLVKSDWGQTDAGTTTDFDLPALMENASGDLPNDRRHSGRLYGSYSWPWGLGLGGVMFWQSGRPINSFGYHPDDARADDLDIGPLFFYTLGEQTPRASMGRTETIWNLDLSVHFDWRWGAANCFVRVDAFNLFDNQGVTRVDEYGETVQGSPNPEWGEPLYYQSPRSVRLGFGVSF